MCYREIAEAIAILVRNRLVDRGMSVGQIQQSSTYLRDIPGYNGVYERLFEFCVIEPNREQLVFDLSTVPRDGKLKISVGYKSLVIHDMIDLNNPDGYDVDPVLRTINKIDQSFSLENES